MKKKLHIRALLISILIPVFVFLGLFHFLSLQSKISPKDITTKAATNRSMVLDSSSQIHIEKTTQKVPGKNTPKPVVSPTPIKESSKPTTSVKVTSTPTATASSQSSTKPVDQLLHLDATPSANTVQNTYFTTSIRNHSTVTSRHYSFTITQFRQTNAYLSTNVTINHTKIPQFSGNVLLEEGDNHIKVACTYKDADHKPFTITKLYQVTVILNMPVLTTTLQDNITTEASTLTFKASAKEGDQDLPVNCLVNEKEITSTDGSFQATLIEGTNTITLHATSKNGKKVRETYHITYNRPIATLTIQTDLTDKTVSDETLHFQAYATDGSKKEKISVTWNDASIDCSTTYDYSVTLRKGTNTFVLSRGSDKKNYTITYVPIIPTPPTTEEATTDPNSPTLVTDLKDNITVNGSIKTFYVKPVDYKGNRIYGRNVTVTCNDMTVPYTWDDSRKTSYKLTLTNGENLVLITITDKEGRKNTTTFHINCNAKQIGEVTGRVTISIQASTVGLGYLVSPTHVEIHEGENAAQILKKTLDDHHYSMEYNGTLNSAFYLTAIKKKDLTKECHIPEDLLKKIQESGENVNPTPASTDALQAQDFNNASGWMFSVNDDYPNYSLTDCTLQDGDTIKIRFSLYSGYDIGATDGLSDETKKEWTKEW